MLNKIYKASSIWKGIRSIVNIQRTSKKSIKLLNDKGKNIYDPKKIVELFNKYFVNVEPNYFWLVYSV